MTKTIQPPKPQFQKTHILYEACVSQNINASSLSTDRADTVMRAMRHNPTWWETHEGIVRSYLTGSDEWNELIKSVRKYAVEYSKYLRAAQRQQQKLKKETDVNN